jgi:soluble P-type ATPase
MIAVDIPGFRALRLEHLVLDYNGTLAIDGAALPGVAAHLRALAAALRIHVITADTFGRVRGELAGHPLEIVITPQTAQAEAKRDFVSMLGADAVVAIGNGRNDRLMLRAAALGIAVAQAEGVSGEALAAADVVVPAIVDALVVLQHPQRLIATLRS